MKRRHLIALGSISILALVGGCGGEATSEPQPETVAQSERGIHDKQPPLFRLDLERKTSVRFYEVAPGVISMLEGGPIGVELPSARYDISGRITDIILRLNPDAKIPAAVELAQLRQDELAQEVANQAVVEEPLVVGEPLQSTLEEADGTLPLDPGVSLDPSSSQLIPKDPWHDWFSERACTIAVLTDRPGYVRRVRDCWIHVTGTWDATYDRAIKAAVAALSYQGTIHYRTRTRANTSQAWRVVTEVDIDAGFNVSEIIIPQPSPQEMIINVRVSNADGDGWHGAMVTQTNPCRVGCTPRSDTCACPL